jgi:hypothetical protein
MRVSQFALSLLLLLLIFPAATLETFFLSPSTVRSPKARNLPQQPSKSWNPSFPSVFVGISPNVELLSIALSMTDWWYQHGVPGGSNYSYVEEVRTWFGNYSDHILIRRLQRLLHLGFSYQAPFNFICHFGPPPDLEQLYNYTPVVYQGAGKDDLDQLAEAFRTFAVETNFTTFHTQQQPFYDTVEHKINQQQNWTEVAETLEWFFGESRASYSAFLTPLVFPSGGYGGWLEDTKGRHVLSFIRAHSVEDDQPVFGSEVGIRLTIFHEFAHNFVNPVVDRHTNDIYDYMDLFTPVASNMTQMGYGLWHIMLAETLIRAFTAWVYGEESANENVSSLLDWEEERGFYFIRNIYEAYGEFAANRDEYSTWEEFFPEILKVLAEIGMTSAPSHTQRGDGLQFLECVLLISIGALTLRKRRA